jgi:MFS family permease
MLGAVTGPLLGMILLTAGVSVRTVIFVSAVPSFAAAASIFFFTRDKDEEPHAPVQSIGRKRLPRAFWIFLVGVFLFGLGDFSRTFLIYLASDPKSGGAMPIAALLYTAHNAVSAIAAYPAGKLGDRVPKVRVLVAGYALGVATNALLALAVPSLASLAVVVVMSGVYIAVEETLEKATIAEQLPRELRSLGFGILACANAVGDMVSSLYVGVSLEAGKRALAFGVPAIVGAMGVAWFALFVRAPVRPAT